MPDRPKLLISVRSAAEAIIALDGGADIIDIKEPSAGALGMADPRVIAEIVAAIVNRVPVSAALGDLGDAPPVHVSADLKYVKVGVSDDVCDKERHLPEHFAAAPGAEPIIALFAESLGTHGETAPLIDRSLDWLETHGGAGLLLDTRDKSAGDLFTCMSQNRIESIITATQSRGLMIALAGRLAGDSIRRAAELSPDIIGVRGAACRQRDRGQMLDAQRVAEVRRLISESHERRDRPARASVAS